MAKIKIAMLITTLSPGGAERYLLRTLQHLDRSKFDVLVLSIGPMGTIGQQIQELGFPVFTANVNSSLGFMLKWTWALPTILRFRPDVIHAWMYHAMAWSIPLRWVLKSEVIWSIRNAKLNAGSLPKTTLRLAKSLGRYSGRVSHVIYNSTCSQNEHEQVGYAPDKSKMIHNGFDRSKLDSLNIEQERKQTLLSHGLNPEDRHIGFVSRYHPQKDIETFLRVACLLKQKNSSFKFITCGQGLGSQDSAFQKQLSAHGLEDQIVSLGVIKDIYSLYPCFDALLLTSREESLPNVIGEAMAYGVPCISTRVGDVQYLLHTEQLCDIGDATSLSDALIETLSLSTEDKRKILAYQEKALRDSFDIKTQQEQLEHLYIETFSRKYN